MSCAVCDMRLAKRAAFSALDGTAVEQVFHTVFGRGLFADLLVHSPAL